MTNPYPKTGVGGTRDPLTPFRATPQRYVTFPYIRTNFRNPYFSSGVSYTSVDGVTGTEAGAISAWVTYW